MKILFDFELVGDAHIDSQLLDIMLDIKSELSTMLADYHSKIAEDAGLVVVTIAAKKLSMRYHDAGNRKTISAVQRLLHKFEWEKVIHRHTQAALN